MSKEKLKTFDESFDIKVFIDKISIKHLHEQNNKNSDIPQFNPNLFIKTFEKTLNQLDKLTDIVDKELNIISKEKEKEEKQYNSNVIKLQDIFNDSVTKFSLIDKQIYERANAAVRIGEQLEIIDKQKEKANEAKLLIEKFSQLNKNQSLPPIMTDDSRIYERAKLLRKLSIITQDLESIPNKTQKGIERVDECCNDLESKLLEIFGNAQSKKNVDKMKECARALCAFNGGNSVVKRYISQQPIFLNVSFWETDNLGLESDKIKQLYKQVKETCKKERIICSQVFPNNNIVMKQLLEKIFLQYIQRLLEKALPYHKGNTDIHSWLKTFELVYDLTNDLIQQVSSYNIPEMDYNDIKQTLFVDYIEEYGEREILWLSNLYKTSIPKMDNKEQNKIQSSGELAIAFINANREAINRCIKLAQPDNKINLIHSILTTLIQYLGYEYLDCMLKQSLSSLQSNINISDDTPLRLSNATKIISSIKNQQLSPKNSRITLNTSISHFFILIKQVTQTIVIFIEYFQNSILPHINHEENQKMQCIIEKNTFISTLEKKLHLGLEFTILETLSQVKYILTTKQNKNDFKIDDAAVFDKKECSNACKETIQLLNQHYNIVKTSLDGQNILNYLTQYGIKLYNIFVEHIKNQQISLGFGGMMLMRDVSKYCMFISKFESEKVSQYFSILKDIANIHIVPSENIKTLIEDSNLSNMDQQELMNIIQLRSDMNNMEEISWRSKLGIKLTMDI